MAKEKGPAGTGVLLLSLLAGADMYGYQMIEALRRQSNQVFTLKAGTLYPLLHGLEAQGLVRSYEGEAVEGRVRRYYAITPQGRGTLEEKRAEWDAYVGAVNAVLGGGPCAANP